eukprot:CAMPEP_0176098404 /NCGR_PEP_ID=MMETSP0120_2-20121206/49339_1 /TAXON_ID=160619 /ORGANISM="Kryptoperidinium foliaceum, Strain CCMP 1326" /LENGTH=104 /DNA_ID=CAMNT_0017432411 /DNA_START=38 /DNA_END=352 /DNA_ORIENTATION=+
MCSDLGEASRCCVGYSFVGALFTLWVGVMLMKQPFYIAGVEDAEEAQASAFGACGMFAFTFVASILGIWYDSQNKASEIEETSGEAGYQLAQDNYPSYGATPSS